MCTSPRCLADLKESFGLTDCTKGNSKGSNVLSKGPSVDQGPGKPCTPPALLRGQWGQKSNELAGITHSSPRSQLTDYG